MRSEVFSCEKAPTASSSPSTSIVSAPEVHRDVFVSSDITECFVFQVFVVSLSFSLFESHCLSNTH